MRFSGLRGDRSSGHDVRVSDPISRTTPSLLGIAVRDLSRLSTVALTVAKHGFGPLLMKTPLGRRLFDRAPEGDAELRELTAPVRFAKLLAALGPTCVKLGQILSMRKDLFAPEWIAALETLQDDAPRLPFAAIREQVEASLGGRLEDLYASFDETPLGTASIAQTHRARTKDGEDVVVKVQRPGIERTMRSDLDLLYLAAQVLEASIDEMQLLGVVAIVEEFEKGLLRELDFHQELSNLLEFQRNLDRAHEVAVPRPHPELSTRTVLTMQFFAGRPIRALVPKSAEAQAAVNEIVCTAFKQVLVDGVFHGDPHAGNLLYGDDGTLCMIDLGMVGRVTPEQRDDIVTLAVATIANDATTIARILLKMGRPTQRVNLNDLKADIERIRSRYVAVASFGEYDSAGFIEEFVKAAGKHRIKLAQDMAILGKAGATLEDIIRTLHPDVDLVGIAKPFLDEIVRRRLSPQRILGEAMSEAAGIGSMLRTVPGQVDQLLHDFETGNLMVRAVTPELDDVPRLLHALAGRLTLAAFASATTIATAIAVPETTESVPRMVVATVLALASVTGWTTLFAWHWLGRGKPLRLTPLLRFFRR
jgi:ubiquinone biosynthesis protein